MAAFADKQRQPSFFIESGTGKEKQKKELIFMGLELYYKIRTKAVEKITPKSHQKQAQITRSSISVKLRLRWNDE